MAHQITAHQICISFPPGHISRIYFSASFEFKYDYISIEYDQKGMGHFMPDHQTFPAQFSMLYPSSTGTKFIGEQGKKKSN